MNKKKTENKIYECKIMMKIHREIYFSKNICLLYAKNLLIDHVFVITIIT